MDVQLLFYVMLQYALLSENCVLCNFLFRDYLSRIVLASLKLIRSALYEAVGAENSALLSRQAIVSILDGIDEQREGL